MIPTEELAPHVDGLAAFSLHGTCALEERLGKKQETAWRPMQVQKLDQ